MAKIRVQLGDVEGASAAVARLEALLPTAASSAAPASSLAPPAHRLQVSVASPLTPLTTPPSNTGRRRM